MSHRDSALRRGSVGILGGGISGIALAAQLGEDVEILEKSSRTGGLCSTIVENGFTFDAAGPHIMFSKNKEVLNLMIGALGDNVHQNRRENRIFFKDKLVKYPFENDLAALPKEDNFDCIYGYIVNPRAGETPKSLADWSYATFGAGISEKYFIPYNEKIWNYDANKIGLEFVARIPKPPMEDVLKSSKAICISCTTRIRRAAASSRSCTRSRNRCAARSSPTGQSLRSRKTATAGA